MIYVDTERCTGCGDCLEACPAGAITLKEGLAFIDESLCRGCEACLSICQARAILAVEPVEVGVHQPTELIPAPVGAIQTRAPVPSVSLLDLARPALGAALLWTGRELVPRLAELALNQLNRRTRPVQRTVDLRSQHDIQIARRSTGGRGRRQGRRRQRYQNRR